MGFARARTAKRRTSAPPPEEEGSPVIARDGPRPLMVTDPQADADEIDRAQSATATSAST